MLTIQQVITEADKLVPNGLDTASKVVQLNAINADFFNTVKIPKVTRFASVVNQADYTLPTDVRSKNIDLVQAGLLPYSSIDNAAVLPTQPVYSFDDGSHVLTFSPAPYMSALVCTCRYQRIATTTFTTSALSATPDAPEEYHWTYIPALAAYLANAEDDPAKAANFEAQYRAAWNTAAQNYVQGGSAKR